MHNNYFDIVMDLIEENADKSTEEIKREIPKLIGRNGRAFSESFALLTGHTLDYYIRQRRLLHAVRDVALKPQKALAQIALEYQFSDQAAFSRAVKAKYHFTPTEIRDKGILLSEDPFRLKMPCPGRSAIAPAAVSRWFSEKGRSNVIILPTTQGKSAWIHGRGNMICLTGTSTGNAVSPRKIRRCFCPLERSDTGPMC